MDNFALMEIANTSHKLVGVELGFDLSQSFSTPHELAQSLVRAKLKHNEHVLFVFEKLVEDHH